jgi:hypothetical protein
MGIRTSYFYAQHASAAAIKSRPNRVGPPFDHLKEAVIARRARKKDFVQR